MLEGVNSNFEGLWNLRLDGKFEGYRKNYWIAKPSKGFRERSNTLIYNGSVTSDLHPLP